MSTDDERRDDGRDVDDGDEYRDPTAPPPLADDGSSTTQPLGSPTQPFSLPSPAPHTPEYDQPTYTSPSYALPSYDTPSSGGTPTAPPGTPAAPYGSAPSPYGAPGQSDPYGAPGTGGGYGQYSPPPPPAAPPSGPPAGEPPSPYATQNPYATGPYTPAPPGGPAYPYSAPPMTPYRSGGSNTGAIVLTVLSGLALVSCCNVLAIPSLVMGIMGISRAATDPVGAQRLVRNGWWVFGISTALVVIGAVVFFALGASGAFDSGGGSSGSFDGY